MEFAGFKFLLSTMISLFVIVDPLGSSSVFATLTKDMTAQQQKRIAWKAVTMSILLLITFGFVGQAILSYMHISLNAFKVAGGMLLFVAAFRMIMGFHDPEQLTSEKSAYKDVSNIALFPISIPLLAGPGVLTTTLLFTTEANHFLDYGVLIFSIVSIQFTALACMLGAGKLARIFGQSGIGIIARIMGILLAALAVQFVVDGIKAMVF